MNNARLTYSVEGRGKDGKWKLWGIGKFNSAQHAIDQALRQFECDANDIRVKVGDAAPIPACPHCGNHPGTEIVDAAETGGVTCTSCGASLKTGETPSEGLS